MKKLRQNNTSKKLNNEGFSLVEVLIAMIILSIVSLTVLKCFTHSIQLNSRAKDNQYVTGAAQSIMESFKAHDSEELIEQFTNPDPSQFTIYTSVRSGETAFDSYSVDLDAMGEPVFPYKFYINGINYDGHKYDSVITVSEFEGTNPVSSFYNGKLDVDYIENMNGYRDALYCESISSIATGYDALLNQVVSWLNTMSGSYHVNEEGIIVWEGNYNRNNIPDGNAHIAITRDTVVDIDSSGSVQTVKINVKYTAKVTNQPYVDSSGHNRHASADFEFVLDEMEVYNNTNTHDDGAALENVFLFFYPAYKDNASAPIKNDKFTINNNLGGSNSINVFYVKQKNNSITNLQFCEGQYVPKIRCNNHVKFFHNGFDNLASKGASVAFNNSCIEAINSSTIITGLTEEKEQNLVYSIDVDIFAEGDTTNPLWTLSGTMNDK